MEIITPYGNPSDKLIMGNIGGVQCALLARHGRKHSIMPGHVNYRANIFALKKVGCTHILAATACGSLKEEIEPKHLVLVDSFIDRTTQRHQTFYDGSVDFIKRICHIPMANPFCSYTRTLVSSVCKELEITLHEKGNVVIIEGPRFGSKAECFMHQKMGADLVNMTLVPEVVLAAEAGICYTSIAMSTDYDCWREAEETVNVEDVLKCMKTNAENVTKIFKEVVPRLGQADWIENSKDVRHQMANNNFIGH